MSAAPPVLEAVTQANAVPFASVFVTLTKRVLAAVRPRANLAVRWRFERGTA